MKRGRLVLLLLLAGLTAGAALHLAERATRQFGPASSRLTFHSSRRESVPCRPGMTLQGGESLSVTLPDATLYRMQWRFVWREADQAELSCDGEGGPYAFPLRRGESGRLSARPPVAGLEILVRDRLARVVLDGSLRREWTLPGSLQSCTLRADSSVLRLMQLDERLGEAGGGEVGRCDSKAVGLALVLVVAAGLFLLLEWRLARRRGVPGSTLTASWLVWTCGLLWWLALTIDHRWLSALAAAAVLLWVFGRLRFWLLRTALFRPDRAGRARPLLAGLSLAAAGVATVGLLHLTEVASLKARLVAGLAVPALLLNFLWFFGYGRQWDFRRALAAYFPMLLLAWPLLFLVALPPPGAGRAVAAFLPSAVWMLSAPLAANRRELRHHGLLMLTAAVFFIGSWEIALRLGDAAPFLRPLGVGATYQTDQDLFWAPKELFGYEADFAKRDDFRVRRMRFRGREETPLLKPPGVKRIMVLGGSNAWGEGQPGPETAFPWLLEKSLREQGYSVEVLNAGVRGYNVFQVMVLFTEYARKYRPDLVVLYALRNDVRNTRGLATYREWWLRRRTGRPDRVTRLQGALRRSVLYNGLADLIVRMREGEATAWYRPELLREVNPVDDFAANLRDIITAAGQDGAQVLLVSEFWGEHLFEGIEMERVRALQQAMEQTAHDAGAFFLDAWGCFMATNNPKHWLLPDDPVHLNAAGHAALAALLEKFLLENQLVIAQVE